MKKKNRHPNSASETYVSPSIKRQIPVLTNLKQAKKLNCTVHFDMIHILSKNIDFDYINEHCTVYREFKPHRYSVGVRYYSEDNIYFSLLGEPEFFGDFVYKIQINPRHFDSSFKFQQFLEKIIGESLTTDNHKINRLDLAFTVPSDVFSAALIHHSCAFKWKRESMTYVTNEFKAGEMTGSRTVSRSLDFSTYDQAAEQRAKKRKGHLSPVSPKSEDIRFEYQAKGCSLDSLGLRTIHQVFNMDIEIIFNRLHFWDISVTYAESEDCIKRFEMFQVAVSHVGFQQARLQYNKESCNNFNRDIGRYLVPLTVNGGKARVSYCFKKRFKEWFSEWKKDE